MNEAEVQKAGAYAEQIGAQVREAQGNLDAVFAALDEAAQAYQDAGGALEAVVPGGGASLGFRRDAPRGRSIWTAFARALHDDLCKPKGTLHGQVRTGLVATGSTLVTLLVTTLGLPTDAALVVAPIAGSILGLGVTAFCKHTEEDK
jgi:hypothetical protein